MSELEYYVNQYERWQRADLYEIYFIYKKMLYSIQRPTLDVDAIRVTTESSKRGGGKKLKMYLNNNKKLEYIKLGASEVMTEDAFNQLSQELKYNKGHVCEYIANKAIGQEHHRDSVRFDLAGDIVREGKNIQIKFENASIVDFSTIDKLVNHN